MAQKKLDPRERRFVAEYLIDLDPRRAAVDSGYSATTAATKAYQWVSNGKAKPHVFEAVEKAKAKRAARTEIDADWVLRRLGDEAIADIGDILDEGGAIRPVSEWPLIWRQGLVSDLDIREEMIEGQSVGRVVKVKVSDRIKRVELIGKHVSVGAFSNVLDHKSSDGSMTPGGMSDDLKAALDAIADKISGGSGASEMAGDSEASADRAER